MPPPIPESIAVRGANSTYSFVIIPLTAKDMDVSYKIDGKDAKAGVKLDKKSCAFTGENLKSVVTVQIGKGVFNWL